MTALDDGFGGELGANADRRTSEAAPAVQAPAVGARSQKVLQRAATCRAPPVSRASSSGLAKSWPAMIWKIFRTLAPVSYGSEPAIEVGAGSYRCAKLRPHDGCDRFVNPDWQSRRAETTPLTEKTPALSRSTGG